MTQFSRRGAGENCIFLCSGGDPPVPGTRRTQELQGFCHLSVNLEPFVRDFLGVFLQGGLFEGVVKVVLGNVINLLRALEWTLGLRALCELGGVQVQM